MGQKLNKEVIILTTLPEKGTTGVQSHLQTLSKLLTTLGITNTIITPYSQKQPILHRLARKLIHITASVDIERAIIMNQEHLQRALIRNISRHTKNSDKPYYVYAQDPGSLLSAYKVSEIYIERTTLICHFNISEINEYNIARGIPESGKLGKYLSTRERDAFRLSDTIIFPSIYLKDIVAQRSKKSFIKSKTVIINNFTDDPGITINNLNFSIDFLSIGTLEPRKNQNFALRVVAALHGLGHKVTIVLVGDGPDRRHLESLAETLGIKDYTTFLGFKENARSYLESARFLIHTARIENFPITLIEALSYGVPICAAPVGGIPEIYSNGIEGTYIDLESPIKSAKKILDLFDPATYRSLRKNARERYEKHFTSSNNATKLCKIILGERS